VVERFGLPTVTDYKAEALAAAALSDKKRSGNRVDLIVPFGIGDCRITPMDITEIQSFIEAGL
jgi:3-dehydroquinate synthase